MKKREQILLVFLVVAAVGWLGLPIVGRVVFGRINDRWDQIHSLQGREHILEDQEAQLLSTQRRLAAWRNRSLPPEPFDAQRVYRDWLTDLAQQVGIRSLRVIPEPIQPTSAAYKSVMVTLKGEAAFEQLVSLLYNIERVDVLERISHLKIEDTGRPGAALTVTITVEGLSLPDATPRERFLPSTQLVASLPRSFDTLSVTSAKEFPSESGFWVRIDDEVVGVQKMSGNDWTVKRTLDGTSAERHASKATVELMPLRTDRGTRRLDEVKKSLAVHPFLTPAGEDPNDPARNTKLMYTGLVEEGQDQIAWLNDDSTKSRTVLHKGGNIAIGDVKGTVVAIESNGIQIDRNGDVFQLRLGQNLRQMTPVNGGFEGMDPGAFMDSPSGPRGGFRGPGPGGVRGPGEGGLRGRSEGGFRGRGEGGFRGRGEGRGARGSRGSDGGRDRTRSRGFGRPLGDESADGRQ